MLAIKKIPVITSPSNLTAPSTGSYLQTGFTPVLSGVSLIPASNNISTLVDKQLEITEPITLRTAPELTQCSGCILDSSCLTGTAVVAGGSHYRSPSHRLFPRRHILYLQLQRDICTTWATANSRPQQAQIVHGGVNRIHHVPFESLYTAAGLLQSDKESKLHNHEQGISSKNCNNNIFMVTTLLPI